MGKEGNTIREMKLGQLVGDWNKRDEEEKEDGNLRKGEKDYKERKIRIAGW